MESHKNGRGIGGMKKTSRNTSIGMALGMCFGVALGSSFGTLFDGNLARGTSIGMSLGLALGLALGALKDKAINEQMEEKGYTVKAIEMRDVEGFLVTIVDRTGGEIVVKVPKGTMEAEQFAVGDIVFLDEDGEIEQAFDKGEQ